MKMKQIGEAQNRQETLIEQAIVCFDGWKGRQAYYAPGSAGRGISNANWRVEVEGFAPAFFVKIPGQGTEMFINRLTAHEASIKAAATGYGAPVVGLFRNWALRFSNLSRVGAPR